MCTQSSQPASLHVRKRLASRAAPAGASGPRTCRVARGECVVGSGADPGHPKQHHSQSPTVTRRLCRVIAQKEQLPWSWKMRGRPGRRWHQVEAVREQNSGSVTSPSISKQRRTECSLALHQLALISFFLFLFYFILILFSTDFLIVSCDYCHSHYYISPLEGNSVSIMRDSCRTKESLSIRAFWSWERS